MEHDEGAVGGCALGLLHHVEADKRHLHGEQGAEHVEGAVGDVEAVAVAASGEEDEDVDGDEVDDEHEAAPGRDHVEVGQGGCGGPHERPRVDGA